MPTQPRALWPGVRHGARLGVAVALALLAGACAGDTSDNAASSNSTGADSADARATSTTSAGSTNEAPLPQPVQQLDIDGTEYVFTVTPEASSGLRPGWTEVRFDNVGVEAHQVMFARLKDGVDMAELAAAGEGDSSGSAAIEFVDMLGGVSYIDAGHETTAMVDLPEGTVLAMCYVPDSHGVAHALMGMTTALSVSPAATPAAGPSGDDDPASGADGDAPAVVGTIELTADGYQIPDDPVRGWYHVVNTDTAEPTQGLHELSLLRLDESLESADLEDLVADLAANATPSVGLEAVGGMGAISAGFDGYLYLDLTPGTYLAADFMPDPGEPRPHLLDGYYAQFEVAG